MGFAWHAALTCCGCAARRLAGQAQKCKVLRPSSQQQRTPPPSPPLQLTFQLPFPALTGYAAYKCVATAANSKGTGPASAVKTTLLPPR